MGAGMMLWGWDGTIWRKALLDATGHLQVDVITAGGTASHCMGWDLANWQPLRVESALLHNLRVRLYAGANPIYSTLMSTGDMANTSGIYTFSKMYGLRRQPMEQRETSADGEAVNANRQQQVVLSRLTGFNGATWDRLRSYGVGILKVGRAEVGLLDVRLTVAGPVGAAGARRLYWMLLNPSAGNSIVELTDAIAAGAAVKADHFDTTRDGHMITFDPPLEFSIGIYLETAANMTSITFGYL